MFIVCSAAVTRARDRLLSVRVVVWAMLASVVVIGIPLVSGDTVLVGFLLARAPLTACMFTIAFPLGARGARRAGITVGAVAALINIAWSVSLLVGPIVFGGVAQASSDSVAYALLIGVFCCSIAWIVAPHRRSKVGLRP